MEFTTELCLAPRKHAAHFITRSSSSEMSPESSESNGSRKRKMAAMEMMMGLNDHEAKSNNNNKPPLPLDWEQCLDLSSGTMYYFNRKTLRKSRDWPKETYHDDGDGNESNDQSHNNNNNNKTLDLELNISSSNKYYNNANHPHHHHHHHHMKLHNHQIPSSPLEEGDFNDKDNNMVALACLNCHLLVILSKSSPCCPNCKYVHSLPPTILHHYPPPQQHHNGHGKAQFPPKPISTLSLLN